MGVSGRVELIPCQLPLSRVQVPNSESLLIFGVDTGAIHLMYFLKPITQLFETPFQKDGGVQKIFMQVRRSALLSFLIVWLIYFFF